jgi:hypothetical protein
MAIRNMQPGNRPDNQIKYYTHKEEKITRNRYFPYSVYVAAVTGWSPLYHIDIPLLQSPTPRLITSVPTLINQWRSPLGRRPDSAALFPLCVKADSEYEASGSGMEPQ